MKVLQTTLVKCPKCGTKIDVNQTLKKQLQHVIEKDLTLKFSTEKNKIEQAIRNQLKEEKSEEILSLQEQLQEKVKEAKAFNRLKADLTKLKREKEELREQVEAESEERLSLILNQEKQKIRNDLQEKSQLKISEKEHMINQLSAQLKKAQQQIEQGSMQTQGEVSELQLEKVLKAAYPMDEISEVAKGANGADIIFTVRNKSQVPCGSIAIESKNTKSFSAAWVDKLKTDQRRHKSEIALLVTEVLPKGFTQFGFLNGVWFCRPFEVAPLIFVLRESLLKIHEIKSANENKDDKVHLLYSYLTNEEFARQIRCVVEGFSSLKTNLEKEKKAMTQVWKEREKLIDQAASSALEIVSEVKLIAGSSVKLIQPEGLTLLPPKSNND